MSPLIPRERPSPAGVGGWTLEDWCLTWPSNMYMYIILYIYTQILNICENNLGLKALYICISFSLPLPLSLSMSLSLCVSLSLSLSPSPSSLHAPIIYADLIVFICYLLFILLHTIVSQPHRKLAGRFTTPSDQPLLLRCIPTGGGTSGTAPEVHFHGRSIHILGTWLGTAVKPDGWG